MSGGYRTPSDSRFRARASSFPLRPAPPQNTVGGRPSVSAPGCSNKRSARPAAPAPPLGPSDGPGDARPRGTPLPGPRGRPGRQWGPGPRGLHPGAQRLLLRRLLQGLSASQPALRVLQRLHRGLGQPAALGDGRRQARLRLPAPEVRRCGRTCCQLRGPGVQRQPQGTHASSRLHQLLEGLHSGRLLFSKGLPLPERLASVQDANLHPRHQCCSPPLEIIQEAGEMVFIPSGWHHQVHNLDDTISINHNWVNGCNLATMWHFLQQELHAVQQEISEWRDSMPDWHHHCQVIMRSCSGINFEEFYHFLKVIAERRLLILGKGAEGTAECGPGTGLGLQHAVFDIGRLAEVLASVIAHPDFQRVDTGAFSPQPEELLRRLEEAIAAAADL
ncbi:2-oxoglutarate and iron-dependent oxygenase JMJD4 isoform X3 [Oryctolagus cuniculus]|uniref:2-oxoglutarate and iron-dependent oxygenase JMJD4 isoform X3 n=1 Tax=Oryctolagus cuniculus TaxID=9986 RepID=UPI00048F426C